MVVGEERGVTLGSEKAQREKKRLEPQEPGARSLFETIQGYLEKANVRGVRGIDKAERLRTVHCLAEINV